MMETGQTLLLATILFIAAVTDVSSHRIPNWLTYPGMLVGSVYHTYMSGWSGLLFSVEGLFLGLGLLLFFYIVAGMGAGDVKLMGAVGGLLGPKGVFAACLCTALVGGVYAVMLLALHGHLKQTVKQYAAILKVFIFTGSFAYSPPATSKETPVLCYGVAIAVGTSISVLRAVV